MNGVAALIRRGERGRHFDGQGLYLVIRSPSNAWYELLFTLNKREFYMGLGSAARFSLKEARQRRYKHLQKLADGINPLEAQRAERAERTAQAARSKTFEQVSEEYLKAHSGEWSVKTHKAFAQRMRLHALPTLGAQPVDKITSPMVLDTLRLIWHKPQTGIKVQQNIASILDFAKAAHYCSGDNPAEWKSKPVTALG
jgi:hypothetical protein